MFLRYSLISFTSALPYFFFKYLRARFCSLESLYIVPETSEVFPLRRAFNSSFTSEYMSSFIVSSFSNSKSIESKQKQATAGETKKSEPFNSFFSSFIVSLFVGAFFITSLKISVMFLLIIVVVCNSSSLINLSKS